MIRPFFARPRLRWLHSVAVILATAAQLVVAFAPLVEGREGPSMAAHVDATGTTGHYTHNDATCAACQARSLHGVASRATALPATGVDQTVVVVADEIGLVSSGARTAHRSRAPPR